MPAEQRILGFKARPHIRESLGAPHIPGRQEEPLTQELEVKQHVRVNRLEPLTLVLLEELLILELLAKQRAQAANHRERPTLALQEELPIQGLLEGPHTLEVLAKQHVLVNHQAGQHIQELPGELLTLDRLARLILGPEVRRRIRE